MCWNRHWRKFATALVACASFASSAEVQAQHLPTTVDLWATYCIAVLQYQLTLFESMPPDTPPEIQHGIAEEKERASTNLLRLRLYLMPRVPDLDPVSLAFALDGGDKDAPEAIQAASQCVESCANNRDGSACLQRCKQSSKVMERVGICSNISWLPL